jgi:hypothetical protein
MTQDDAGSAPMLGSVANGWISVTERLPESGEMVMVWDYGEHLMAWLNFTSNGTAYFSAQGRSNFEVTHWMPLPAPPLSPPPPGPMWKYK